VPLNLLTKAYGAKTDGTDGGCFVEFKRILPDKGSASIPKYAEFPIDNDVTSMGFCKHWFNHSGGNNNIFQLVAACKHGDGSLGTTVADQNICFVTVAAHTSQASLNDTVVHEVGHQFEVSGAHVDSDTLHHPNHKNSDDCIMTYVSDDTDGKSEFCIDNCIKVIRKQSDPR